MPADRFVPLVRVGKAHGVRGEVKLHRRGDAAPLLGLSELRDAAGRTYPFKLTSKGETLIAHLGLADRNAAEALHGTELGTLRSALPEADEATYASDLVGLSVVSPEGTAIGTVHDIVDYGAGDIIVINTATGELMLPYAEQFFPGEPGGSTLVCVLPEILSGKE